MDTEAQWATVHGVARSWIQTKGAEPVSQQCSSAGVQNIEIKKW